MRRSDKEIDDLETIHDIVRGCRVWRVDLDILTGKRSEHKE
jgi:hypothetical protein